MGEAQSHPPVAETRSRARDGGREGRAPRRGGGGRTAAPANEGAARDTPSPPGGLFTSWGTAGSFPRGQERGGRHAMEEGRGNTSLGLGGEGPREGHRARPSAKVSREGSQQERDSGARPPATGLQALSPGLFGDRHILQRRFIRTTVKRRLNSGKLSPSLLSCAKLPTHAPERLSRVQAGARALRTRTCRQGGLSDADTAQPEGSCGSRGAKGRGQREGGGCGGGGEGEKALLSKTRGSLAFSTG